jgi:hypothetical protein
MAYKDNEHLIVDAVGQKVYKGDRVVFCHRGWDGKEANLQLGTVRKITKCGVWIYPDNPRFGRKYGHYDYTNKKWCYDEHVETFGLKWSHGHLIVKLGS